MGWDGMEWKIGCVFYVSNLSIFINERQSKVGSSFFLIKEN